MHLKNTRSCPVQLGRLKNPISMLGIVRKDLMFRLRGLSIRPASSVILFTIFCFLAFVSCKGSFIQIKYGKGVCQKIEVGPGPEDLAYESKNNRLIISSHERRKWEKSGDIYAVSLGQYKQKDQYGSNHYHTVKLKRVGEPDSLALRPHGISLIKKNDGKYLLYVISHGETSKASQHEIVVYELKGNELRFIKRIQNPLLHSPNDLFALSSGEIFVINDGIAKTGLFDLIFKQYRGDLVYYHENKGWRILQKDIGSPTGIYVSHEYLFVSASLENLVYQYKIKPDRSLELIHQYAVSIPDNILSVDQENLFTASHGSLFDFWRHMRDGSKLSPSLVYLLNTKEHTSKIIYADSGETISAASSAIEIKKRLFISQVFENFVVVCL